ncbi:hypothetical protein C4546_05105 [Candidatus Parcubacteria bacterium]|jgi:hypothetical protein|nr:MAG: hypothetical protein C4546_05105 [Candidatus Parcubacteria bacterium]
MKCQFTKQDGQQCEGNAIYDSQYCFSHNPDSRQAKNEAVLNGGLALKKIKFELEEVEIKSIQDITALLAKTINELRTNKIPPKIAVNIGYLSNIMITSLKEGEIEKRLEVIENAIKLHKSNE